MYTVRAGVDMLTGYEGQQTTDSSLLMQTAATPINMTCATPTLLVLLHTPSLDFGLSTGQG